LLVLDSNHRPSPVGQIGDLYISGVGLSPGYWRDPQKTDAAFLVWHDDHGQQQRVYKTGDLASVGEDGLVYFLGRCDTQIKSRGYRIELGEIESAFNAMEALQDCAIVAIPSSGFEGTAICCAFVPKNGSAVSPAHLRKQALKFLPSYMLPGRWKRLSQLPKNPNGKIDRPALQKLFGDEVSAEPVNVQSNANGVAPSEAAPALSDFSSIQNTDRENA
jgi:acyl-coenzyme A synthetase/AMP-(fatty) acid ligase